MAEWSFQGQTPCSGLTRIFPMTLPHTPLWGFCDPISISQLNKLRLREVKLNVQGHSTGKEKELLLFSFYTSGSFLPGMELLGRTVRVCYKKLPNWFIKWLCH